jgi:hypothetical protein
LSCEAALSGLCWPHRVRNEVWDLIASASLEDCVRDANSDLRPLQCPDIGTALDRLLSSGDIPLFAATQLLPKAKIAAGFGMRGVVKLLNENRLSSFRWVFAGLECYSLASGLHISASRVSTLLDMGCFGSFAQMSPN